MSEGIVLASASEIRGRLLREAGVKLQVRPVAVDEALLRCSLEAEGAAALDMATALAAVKAARRSTKESTNLVLGCDQILQFEGKVFGKASNREGAREMLSRLRGKTHTLVSAAVFCESGREVWRGASQAEVTFRNFSDSYLDSYLEGADASLLQSVGCYHIEAEGIRLISGLKGDVYAVYGLPLIPILGYLIDRNVIDG
ncbi:MAG: Maf family protein [Rhodobacteraceae bacterium]|nr:Maf family protein [Paracoccaceae bacterium]